AAAHKLATAGCCGALRADRWKLQPPEYMDPRRYCRRGSIAAVREACAAERQASCPPREQFSELRQMVDNRVVPEAGNSLRHELVCNDLGGSPGFPDDALSKVEGRRSGHARMHIQQEPVVLDAACDVQLADVAGIELVEKCRDVESVVMCVAFQVVGIEDQATAGSLGEGVEKTSFRVI